MEGLNIRLPIKRGKPRKSFNPKVNLKSLQEQTSTKISLVKLQNQYIKNFMLEKFENSTWQYIVSNHHLKSCIDYRLLELLSAAIKEFMLSELEYIAVISLLQRKNINLLNIPISMLSDLSCFVVKLQMEADQELVKLLHQKLSGKYSNFEGMLKKFESVSKINTKDLNKIYGDFNRIIIQDPNYCVKVGDILRKCTLYNTKNKLTQNKKETFFKGDEEISGTSETSKSNDRKTKFLSLVPVDIQTSKEFTSEVKKSFDSGHYLLNNQEFENGFYNAEEFQSIV